MDAKVVSSEISAKRHVTYVVSLRFEKIHKYSIISPILQRMILNQNLNVKAKIVAKLNMMVNIIVNAFAVMMRTH